MTLDLTQVGKAVRSLRMEKGLTQEQLAAQAELSPAHLSRIEMGTKNVSLESLVRLSKILDVTTDVLLGNVPACEFYDAEWSRLTADCLPEEKRKLIDGAEALKNIFLRES